MYGTHYSSAGVVLHYLVRQEPFTSLHIQLQVTKLGFETKFLVNSRHTLFFVEKTYIESVPTIFEGHSPFSKGSSYDFSLLWPVKTELNPLPSMQPWWHGP